MTRNEAKLAGEIHFSTGKPCKYGHTSKRYVKNGACVECLSPGESSPRVSERLELDRRRVELSEAREKRRVEELRLKEEARQQREARKAQELALRAGNVQHREERSQHREMKAQTFVKMRAYCPPADIDVMKKFVLLCAQMRAPAMKMSDVWPNLAPTNDVIYTFIAAPEDRDVIKDYGLMLADVRYPKSEVAKAREQIQANIAADPNLDDSNWPEGDPT